MGKKRGELVIIGGHEDRQEYQVKGILGEFVQLAGEKKACIIVMTVATTSPDELGRQYVEAFEDPGVADVQTLDIASREGSYSREAAELLKRATGVFFTGGSPLDRLIHQRFLEDGLVIAGTSAGAAIMADTMILNGDSETSPSIAGINLGSGLGYVDGIVIDRRFSQRGRIGRLVGAVAQNPRYLGIGIDENTAIVIENTQFRVLGAGPATVIDASDMRYNNFATAADHEPLALEGLKLSIVAPGHAFHISERRLIRNEPQKAEERV